MADERLPEPDRRALVELDRLIAETHKLVAEQGKLLSEQSKLHAEERKFLAERSKLRVDLWLGPVIVLFGGLGSLVAAYAAVGALFHSMGLK
jgi:hypothetical protein